MNWGGGLREGEWVLSNCRGGCVKGTEGWGETGLMGWDEMGWMEDGVIVCWLDSPRSDYLEHLAFFCSCSFCEYEPVSVFWFHKESG